MAPVNYLFTTIFAGAALELNVFKAQRFTIHPRKDRKE